MVREDDSQKISAEQLASALTPKIQQLIILPTEKCNFRCTYCYEDFAIGKMSDRTQTAVERFMSRRIPEVKLFSIEWFGGEPLVARNVVLRLSSHANKICADNDVSLEGGLTTNAYLLKFDLFEELVSYNQRNYQITLDGWGETHNEVRRLAGGGGTFDKIWENLCATRKSRSEFSIRMRLHLRRGNLASVERLLDELATEFRDDHRYQIDFQHLRNLGGEGGKTVEKPFSLQELRVIEAELFERYSARVSAGPSPAPASPEESGKYAPHICYAAKGNSLLIRADGRIGKCTVALTDDRNTVGKINDDGTVFIEGEKLRLWARGLASLDAAELHCPLVNLPKLPVLQPASAEPTLIAAE